MYTNVTTNAQGGGGGNSPVHQQQNQRESIQRLRSQHCGKSEQLFILWYREELKKLGRPLPKVCIVVICGFSSHQVWHSTHH